MKFFEELRKGAHNYISKIKESMRARAVENKAIKEIEHKAAFQERKKQAVKTAKFRVQLKGKQDRERIKTPFTPTAFNTPQPNQTKGKKQNKEAPQDIINPNAAMDMVNYNPFKTK